MSTKPGLDRAAIVLNSLPAEVAEKVLAALGPQRAERVRPRMEALAGTVAAEVGEVIRELEAGMQKPETPPEPAPHRLSAYRPPSEDEPGRSQTRPSVPRTPVVDLPDDPMEALAVLPVEVLTAVLQGEQVHTVALVLNCLSGERAGEILKQLTPEVRREVSVRVGRMGAGNPQLVAWVVQALIHKARALGASPAEPSAAAKYEKMAQMLRVLEKTERGEVIAALEEKDPETAARVKELLYHFDDLLRIHDRGMQKLLSEIDSKSLAVALKGASDEIRDKVMSNLSKRARETLAEEMDLLGTVLTSQVTQAQKAVVEVIQRLDQAGELVMDE